MKGAAIETIEITAASNYQAQLETKKLNRPDNHNHGAWGKKHQPATKFIGGRRHILHATKGWKRA